MNRVILSPEYFPDPTIGRPISGAQIYVGKPDLDPEVVINQKQVSFQQEDGTIVPVGQPVLTGAGGVPIYQGAYLPILVDGNYSLKVLDKHGAQIYYVPTQLEAENSVLYVDLRTLATGTGDEVYLSGRDTVNDGGQGHFIFDSSDLSVQVAADAESGIYVAPNSDLTGANGAWVRQYVGAIYPAWFGADANDINDPVVVTAVPVYNIAATVLSVTDFRQEGEITLPAGKQHNAIRMEGDITDGTKFAGINFEYTITDSVDSYCAIGLLRNAGSGASKAAQFRALAEASCTGIIVGVVAGTTVDSASSPTNVFGLQISMSGYEVVTAGNHNCITIGTGNDIGGDNDGVIVLDHGIVSDTKVGYSDSFIKAMNFTDGDVAGVVQRPGDFLRWQDGNGTAIFQVDKDGAIFKKNAANVPVFEVQPTGSVILGDITDAQKSLDFVGAVTTFRQVGTTAGDTFDITDNTVGRTLMQFAGGAGGAVDAVSIWVDSALKAVTAGAANSGGAGFKLLRVPN